MKKRIFKKIKTVRNSASFSWKKNTISKDTERYGKKIAIIDFISKKGVKNTKYPYKDKDTLSSIRNANFTFFFIRRKQYEREILDL